MGEWVYGRPAALPTEIRTVKNYPGETPILDAAAVVWPNNPLWVEGVITVTRPQQNYSVIDGINVINVLSPEPANIITFNKTGITNGDASTHITVKNCYTYNTVSSGIYFSGVGHTIDNNEVELFTTGGQQEGITIYNGDSVTVSNNYVHDIGNYNSHNNGIGIDFKNGGSGHRCFGNRVHNAKIVGIYVDARGAPNDLEIYDNEVYNVDANPWPTNHGIVVADEAPDGVNAMTNIKVYNNIIYNIGTNGIAIGWTGHDGEVLENCYFVNNTIYDTNYGISLYVSSIDGGITTNPSFGIYIENNIMYNQSVQSIASFGVVNYDSYIVDTNVMSGFPVGLTVTNPLDVNPLFTDAINGDFTLQIASPAIDVGKNTASYIPAYDFLGNTRVINSTIDIGAYEKQ